MLLVNILTNPNQDKTSGWLLGCIHNLYLFSKCHHPAGVAPWPIQPQPYYFLGLSESFLLNYWQNLLIKSLYLFAYHLINGCEIVWHQSKTNHLYNDPSNIHFLTVQKEVWNLLNQSAQSIGLLRSRFKEQVAKKKELVDSYDDILLLDRSIFWSIQAAFKGKCHI